MQCKYLEGTEQNPTQSYPHLATLLPSNFPVPEPTLLLMPAPR